MVGKAIRKSLEYHTKTGSVYSYTVSINQETMNISDIQFLRRSDKETSKGIRKIPYAAYVSEERCLQIIREYRKHDKGLMSSKEVLEKYFKRIIKQEQLKKYENIGGRIIYLEEGHLKASSVVEKIEKPKVRGIQERIGAANVPINKKLEDKANSIIKEYKKKALDTITKSLDIED